MESIIPVMNCVAVMQSGEKCIVKATHMARDDNVITVYLNSETVGYFSMCDLMAIYLSMPSEKK